MTISIKSPTSTTGSIQKNGSDVITIDASDNVTVANGLTVSGNISTSGTIPAEQLTGDLPAISGANLTDLPLPAGGFSNMQVFTSSGTWTNPGSVTKVKVTVVGGGQAGNYVFSSARSGGGGGAGGTAIEVATIPTSPVAVTVGAGGAISPANGNTTNGLPGLPGGVSSFGAYCSATGGYRASPAVNSNNITGGKGGIGSGGNLNIRGGAGDSINYLPGNNTGPGGHGGNSFLGGGGHGAVWNNISAAESGVYGGGGGGGHAATNTSTYYKPAPGGNGVVIVEY